MVKKKTHDTDGGGYMCTYRRTGAQQWKRWLGTRLDERLAQRSGKKRPVETGRSADVPFLLSQWSPSSPQHEQNRSSAQTSHLSVSQILFAATINVSAATDIAETRLVAEAACNRITLRGYNKWGLGRSFTVFPIDRPTIAINWEWLQWTRSYWLYRMALQQAYGYLTHK